jgi:hypothetical protein
VAAHPAAIETVDRYGACWFAVWLVSCFWNAVAKLLIEKGLITREEFM